LSGFSGATCPWTVLAAFRNAGVFLIIHKDYDGTVIIDSDVRQDTPRCEFERLARKEAVMAAMCAENYEEADLDPNEVEGGRKYSDRRWMDEEGEEYKDEEGVE
jgi:hypothetical protein